MQAGLQPSSLAAGLGMVAVAVGSATWWLRRAPGTARFLLWGAGSWVLAIALKSVASVPLPGLIRFANEELPAFFARPLLALYIGLLTGIFECGLVVLLIRKAESLSGASWSLAVGFGIGFGAVEALLVGLGVLVLNVLAAVAPHLLPPQVLKAASTQMSLLLAPAPIIERLNALLIHVGACLIVFFSVREGLWRWFWLAFAYKVLVDGVVGAVHLSSNINQWGTVQVWLLELALLPFGLFGLWLTLRLRSRWRPTVSAESEPSAGELPAS